VTIGMQNKFNSVLQKTRQV